MSFGGGGGGSGSISGSTDVALSNPADADVLTYNGTLGKWKNAPPTGGAPTYANLPAGSLIIVDYNTGSSSYPNRPSARTDIVVRWRGPVAPTIGGSGAINNVDEWLNTSP